MTDCVWIVFVFVFVVVGLLTGFAILQARAPRVSVQRGAERADKRDRSTWNYHYTMRAGELRKKERGAVCRANLAMTFLSW